MEHMLIQHFLYLGSVGRHWDSFSTICDFHLYYWLVLEYYVQSLLEDQHFLRLYFQARHVLHKEITASKS